QRDVIVLGLHAAGDQAQAVDVQGIVVGNAARALAQLEQAGPVFGLAGTGDQLLQRIALGGLVAGLIGAAPHPRQGGFVARTQAPGVLRAAGIITGLVISLAHNQLGLSVENIVLFQELGVGDHVFEVAGIVVLGELGLGAAGRVRISRRYGDRILE